MKDVEDILYDILHKMVGPLKNWPSRPKWKLRAVKKLKRARRGGHSKRWCALAGSRAVRARMRESGYMRQILPFEEVGVEEPQFLAQIIPREGEEPNRNGDCFAPGALTLGDLRTFKAPVFSEPPRMSYEWAKPADRIADHLED